MKIRSLILISIFILSLISCFQESTHNEAEKDWSLEPIDSAVFDVGFFFMPAFSAQYFDRESQEELLFFADPKTHKLLKFFKRDGSLHSTVDLKSAVDALPEFVLDLEVISLDSILLFTSHGYLVAINRKGEVWKQFNLIQKLGLDKDKKHSYEFLSSIMDAKGMINNNDIILYISNSLKKQFDDHYNWIIANKANKWNSKQFIRINDIISDNPSFRMGGELLKAISPEDSNALIIDIFNRYNIIGDSVYITHDFSDKLFIMDANNMEIVKSKEIQSEYTPFGVQVYSSINKLENEKVYPLVEKGMQENGKLYTVLYNVNKKHYYISADIDKHTPNSGKWLFLVYDQEFNKLKEYIFDPNEWLGRIFPTKNGFTLQRNISSESLNDQKIVLYDFTY